MKLSLFVIFLSGLASVFLTLLAKRLAFALGAIDHPGGRRRVHEREIPRLGGIAIFLPVMLSVALGFWIVPGGGRTLGRGELFGLLVACGCIFLLGAYDDIRGANAPMKLTVQIAAAGWLYFSGVHIWEVWTPFGWMMTLGIFALPFTVLWLVGLSNGMNLLDGVDGLAAGVGAISALTILIISTSLGDTQISILAAALFGSLLGFLWFNFYPAQIFLGDCGALFLGFFLAAISVLGNQKSASAIAMAVPIVALGIPIFDTSLAVIRRVLRGKHPFQADRDHLHHRLMRLGLTQPQVALVLYAVSGALAIMALLMSRANRAVAALIVLCVILVIIGAMNWLKAGEFRELAALFQHGERRRRPPRYRAILVRNTLPLLERCETVDALRALLEEVRKDLGFVTLQVRFTQERAPALLKGATEVTVADPNSPSHPDLVQAGGTPSWTGRAEILCPMWNGECGMRNERERQEPQATSRAPSAKSGGARVVGEVVATKPAWKRRRASENDDELLQFLADGLGRWMAERMKT